MRYHRLAGRRHANGLPKALPSDAKTDQQMQKKRALQHSLPCRYLEPRYLQSDVRAVWCVVLCRAVLSLVRSCMVSPCLALPFFRLPCLVSPCLALPRLALPCFALAGPVLSCARVQMYATHFSKGMHEATTPGEGSQPTKPLCTTLNKNTSPTGTAVGLNADMSEVSPGGNNT